MESLNQAAEGAQPPPTALDRALAVLGYGGQAIVARHCKVQPQAVTHWIRKGRVPPEHVLAVEELTGVSRHELREDVFGPPPEPPAEGRAAA